MEDTGTVQPQEYQVGSPITLGNNLGTPTNRYMNFTTYELNVLQNATVAKRLLSQSLQAPSFYSASGTVTASVNGTSYPFYTLALSPNSTPTGQAFVTLYNASAIAVAFVGTYPTGYPNLSLIQTGTLGISIGTNTSGQYQMKITLGAPQTLNYKILFHQQHV